MCTSAVTLWSAQNQTDATGHARTDNYISAGERGRIQRRPHSSPCTASSRVRPTQHRSGRTRQSRLRYAMIRPNTRMHTDSPTGKNAAYALTVKQMRIVSVYVYIHVAHIIMVTMHQSYRLDVYEHRYTSTKFLATGIYSLVEDALSREAACKAILPWIECLAKRALSRTRHSSVASRCS